MKVIGRTGSRGQVRPLLKLACIALTLPDICIRGAGHPGPREVLGRPEPPDYAQRQGARPRGCVCPTDPSIASTDPEIMP